MLFLSGRAAAQEELFIGTGVHLSQTGAVREAYRETIASNPDKMVNGFRIRIYSGNGKNSDYESEIALRSFQHEFPDISAERSYSNSSYKVTAGYYRTKADAARDLARIRRRLGSGFIVSERFRYPELQEEIAAAAAAAAAAKVETEEQSEP